MRVYVQWAKQNPEDWFAWDITRDQDVRRAAKKAVPNANSVLDDNPGWVCGANCQGLDFTGWDHIAVEVVGDGLRITGWQDDPEDFGDQRYAVEWTLMPPAFDARFNQVNTVQSCRIFATPDAMQFFPVEGVLPWQDFVLPPSSQTFHGIWLPDEKFQEHVARRTMRGWREWIG